MTIVPLDDILDFAVEALLDRAFGADRRTRTAYRLRLGVAALSGLSFAAIDDHGVLLATIQTWPVEWRGDDGTVVAMILVGPVAVEPATQRGGVGRRIMQHMLDAAYGAPIPGTNALMLIGDPEYYGRFFDFTAERTGGWRLPGPFESRRLLALGDGVPAGPGDIAPRLS